MTPENRTIETAVRGCTLLALVVACSVHGRALAGTEPAPGRVARIVVAFKLDPRLTQALYMGERWVAPASYNSISAPSGTSISVEARAHGVDTRGRMLRINPEWTSSDPEMATVTPARGSAVTITVRRPGASTITLRDGGTSRKLTLQTVSQSGGWRVDVSQESSPAPSPSRSQAKRTAR